MEAQGINSRRTPAPILSGINWITLSDKHFSGSGPIMQISMRMRVSGTGHGRTC